MKRLLLIFVTFIQITCLCLAKDNSFDKARALQRDGKFDEAIESYRNFLVKPTVGAELTSLNVSLYADALLQMMNSYQSKGEPDACVAALQEVFRHSPILQDQCLRDYNSILGYALSRTERMKEAEETIFKALTLSLKYPTPERYFRDYAYAAAVFYSNPAYHNEVINWCQEALTHAKSSKNTSGQQWVMSMLASLYKRDGNLDKAFELYQQSKNDAESRNDDLGVLNSLNSLVDFFLYWELPEYAHMYASEAVNVETRMSKSNPMVSAQTYINKGRVLHQLGRTDSLDFYIEKAALLCESLPYNSGMVDIDLLNGICQTERGDLDSGIERLQRVAAKGTDANRARAYHQLAHTYLKHGMDKKADVMLDSLSLILSRYDSPSHIIHIDYKPVIDHYLKRGDQKKVGQYVDMMLHEQKSFEERGLNYNLVESLVELHTGSRVQELKIEQLRQANQRLWLLNIIVFSVIITAFVLFLLFYQRKKHARQMRRADEKLASLDQKLKQSNLEKEKIEQDVRDFLSDKDKRQELETMTPYILKESGETKFRQCFELLYPLFLPRLREKVPSVSRREELLSMLIALKQDNRNIAELLAIAPRSVLMLRHRFRQKIGLNTEYSLENFIEDLLP